MKLSQMSFTRRNTIGLLLIGVASVLLFSRLTLVQNAAPQQTKRTFENKIPAHVPLKVKIKKEKEDKDTTGQKDNKGKAKSTKTKKRL